MLRGIALALLLAGSHTFADELLRRGDTITGKLRFSTISIQTECGSRCIS
jgi:hypothetical protein